MNHKKVAVVGASLIAGVLMVGLAAIGVTTVAGGGSQSLDGPVPVSDEITTSPPPSATPSQDPWAGTGFTRAEHEAAREKAISWLDALPAGFSLGDETCGADYTFLAVGIQPARAMVDDRLEGAFPIDIDLYAHRLGATNYLDHKSVDAWWTVDDELIWAEDPPAYETQPDWAGPYWPECRLDVIGQVIE